MKLNQKGYLVVELVISFVLAMSMAFMLLDLTTKAMAKNEDEYKDIKLETDKALITNAIMDDLKDYKIREVKCSGKTLTISTDGGNKELQINGKELNYDNGVYKKNIDDSITIGDEFICTNSEDYKLSIAKISMTTRYSANDYGLILMFNIEQ